MQSDRLIPSTYTQAKLEENLPKGLVASQSYRKELKNASVMFLHYLLTYADEIAKEKGVSQIGISTLREALLETDFSDIVRQMEEGSRPRVTIGEGSKKRNLSQLQKLQKNTSEQEIQEETDNNDF